MYAHDTYQTAFQVHKRKFNPMGQGTVIVPYDRYLLIRRLLLKRCDKRFETVICFREFNLVVIIVHFDSNGDVRHQEIGDFLFSFCPHNV